MCLIFRPNFHFTVVQLRITVVKFALGSAVGVFFGAGQARAEAFFGTGGFLKGPEKSVRMISVIFFFSKKNSTVELIGNMILLLSHPILPKSHDPENLEPHFFTILLYY